VAAPSFTGWRLNCLGRSGSIFIRNPRSPKRVL
jgi:hypothetical protein